MENQSPNSLTMRENFFLPALDLCPVLELTPQGIHSMLKNGDIKSSIKGNKKILYPDQVRDLLISRGQKYPKENIAFSVVKGGVGKTSLSYSFAVRASQYGAKILCVDIDQQGNLSQALQVDDPHQPTLYHLIDKNIKEIKNIDDIILKITPNIDLIPSNMENSVLDRYLQVHNLPLQTLFNDLLSSVRNKYDYVIFDCPPSLGSLTSAAALAANRIIMPVIANKFSIQGLKVSIEEISYLTASFKARPPLINIIFNRYDARKSSSSDFLKELLSNNELSQYLLKTFIRENAEIDNSINNNLSIFELPRKTPVREDVDLFTREVMDLNFFQKTI